jgi:hypothetical protein
MEKNIVSEDLAVWFGKKKKPKGSKQPKGPWVNICRKDKDGKHPPCGRSSADEGAYPKCRAAGVAGKMSDSEKKAACSQKRRAEKKDTQTGKGQKPVMTSYKPKSKKNESIDRLVNMVLENMNDNKSIISEGMKYHLDNKIPVCENVYRFGSKKFFEIINEARRLKDLGLYENEEDDFILESELGTFFKYKGQVLPLDLPMEDLTITEAEYQGKDVELNSPKRGGSKKFYVYTRNPQTGKIIKVSFGAKSGGGKLSVKFKDPKRRKAFADRHNCSSKKDKTSPGYWSCRLPRYAEKLGLGSNMNTYW